MATRQQTPTLQSRGDYAPVNGAAGSSGRPVVSGGPATAQRTSPQQQQRARVKPIIPVVHEIAWVSLVLQLFFVMLLIFVAAGFGFVRPILTGTLTYLIVGFLARLVFTRHHRQGMYLTQEGLFDEAVAEFQKSYEFFSSNRWIDWWRYVLMLSSSRMTYREMALLNIAFCDIWNERPEDAVRTYLRIIEEFPDNGIAWTAIKTFQQGGHDGERRARLSLGAAINPGAVAGPRPVVPQVSAE